MEEEKMEHNLVSKIHVSPSDMANYVRVTTFDDNGNFISYEEEHFNVLFCKLAKKGKMSMETLETGIICIKFEIKEKSCKIM